MLAFQQRQLEAEDQQEIKALLKQLAVMPEGLADLDSKSNVRACPPAAHCSCVPTILMAFVTEV